MGFLDTINSMMKTKKEKQVIAPYKKGILLFPKGISQKTNIGLFFKGGKLQLATYMPKKRKAGMGIVSGFLAKKKRKKQ